jgi:signal transduction histidine kinase
MAMPLSLRGRLMLGAFLWTAGLIVVSGIAITHTMSFFPRQNLAAGLRWTYLKPLPPIAIATVCMLTGLWQVRRGLTPVNRLRERLSSVHGGREPRVTGRYPIEVQPLVDDLNALLAERERTVARAMAKAADLAHGLKTPLSILAQDAADARAAGQPQLADSIEHQVDRMRRQVDFHLAQARAAGASPTTRTVLGNSVDGLIRTMQRLHAERALRIASEIAPEHAVKVQREDVDEMLGNLLDNACKWARSCVRVTSASAGGRIAIRVDDDGPGLDESMRESVLRRGVRADQSVPGSGLGLAITRDLVELYQGTITLGRSPVGGLRAEVTLPAASM